MLSKKSFHFKKIELNIELEILKNLYLFTLINNLI